MYWLRLRYLCRLLFLKRSNKDGVIVLSTDGLESVKEDNVNLSQLSKDNYAKTDFTNNASIMSGDPIYKLITSDYWTLMFVIEDDIAEGRYEDAKNKAYTLTFDEELSEEKAEYWENRQEELLEIIDEASGETK